jgi:hypothetical protein
MLRRVRRLLLFGGIVLVITTLPGDGIKATVVPLLLVGLGMLLLGAVLTFGPPVVGWLCDRSTTTGPGLGEDAPGLGQRLRARTAAELRAVEPEVKEAD